MGWEAGVFKIWVYFSLSYSDFISDKLNFFAQTGSLFPMMERGG